MTVIKGSPKRRNGRLVKFARYSTPSRSPSVSGADGEDPDDGRNFFDEKIAILLRSFDASWIVL